MKSKTKPTQGQLISAFLTTEQPLRKIGQKPRLIIVNEKKKFESPWYFCIQKPILIARPS